LYGYSEPITFARSKPTNTPTEILKTYKEAVRTRDFAISAELLLRPETDAESIRTQAAVLRNDVDAILLTDNQYGQLHLSTLAAASILLQIGIDPVVQLSCRNRNRISLLSDLMGAAALGVTSLLLVRGERVPDGFEPRPKAVMDVNASELIRIATTMKSDERLKTLPDFFVGGLVTAHGPKPGWVPGKLHKKIEAGLQFVQMHLCMNVNLLRDYMKFLVADRTAQRVSMMGSVAVLSSAEDAKWLRDHRPNVMIPEALVKRLEAATDPQEEGIRICAEVLQELAAIPGIAGANIIATRDLTTIPKAIRLANLNRD
jgi:methylenetetrahydrofolate reductase (NADPH)